MSATDIQYTSGDFERLGTVKKGADEVYKYFRWVMEDHTRILVEKDHQRAIEKLTDDVSTILGLPAHKGQLALYFIANVIHSIREVEESRTFFKGWTVFNDDMLRELYKPTEVSFLLGELTAQSRCMYAGIFMSEQTTHHEKLDLVNQAQLVGADNMFIMTVEWPILLEVMEEEDTDYDAVGRALVKMSARIPLEGTVDDLMKALAGIEQKQ